MSRAQRKPHRWVGLRRVPKRTFDIVAPFYMPPEKPKRAYFRFVAMWWLCRFNVACKSHSDPTNGLLADATYAGRQDGKHLQMKGLDPVSVGAVGVLSQPNLAHLLAHRGPVELALRDCHTG